MLEILGKYQNKYKKYLRVERKIAHQIWGEAAVVANPGLLTTIMAVIITMKTIILALVM
jgi:hypothetical protein